MMQFNVKNLLCLFVLLAVAAPTHAQAPINSNVALQPDQGGLIIRQQLRYFQAEQVLPADLLELRMASSITTMAYGASESLTLMLETPVILSRRIDHRATGKRDSDSGLGDVRLMSKLRLYHDDFGANSTTRMGLLAGLELPVGNDAFSSESVDPIIGAVFTHIDGRHAVDVDALWQFNTGGGGGSEDRLSYDLAYSYRLSPDRYAADRPSGLFGSVELNGSYATGGDHEMFVSPGIQYITTDWILEATVQIPVWQDIERGSQRDFVIGVGFRVQI